MVYPALNACLLLRATQRGCHHYYPVVQIRKLKLQEAQQLVEGHLLGRVRAGIGTQASLAVELMFLTTPLVCNLELDSGVIRRRVELEKGRIQGLV